MERKLGLVMHTVHPNYNEKPKIGGLWSRTAWAIKQDPISKITRVKRAGGIAEAVESLPSKWESLSSNSRTAKKQKLVYIDFKIYIY
jgi:hypothetical protein